MFVEIALLVIILLVLVLPMVMKKVEENLEAFLFLMGLISVIIAGILSLDLVHDIFTNRFLYFITAAVLIAGFIFNIFIDRLEAAMAKILKRVSLPVFVFLMIVLIGIVSSVITAIIAALLLVELIQLLPLKRQDKIKICVLACLSIGLGAALTPLGEPLSTIVVSKLKAGFWYLFSNLGLFIIPGIITTGLIGALITSKAKRITEDTGLRMAASTKSRKKSFISKDILMPLLTRGGKVFLFILALELLGAGFKPLIDMYVIKLDSHILYWMNMVSAVLDNATLAAAEISPLMSAEQIRAILMGLLVSGGMLIPGNIPNIISADKMKIGSREWARTGIPLILPFLVAYYVLMLLVL